MGFQYVDVFIIGAGPIGLACGIEASKAGLSYVVVDKGCLVNSLYNYPLNMTFFSTSEKLEIGGVPFVSHHPKPNRGEALEYYRRVAMTSNLNVKLYEEVISAEKVEQTFEINTAKGQYRASKLIVATGFYDIPCMLGVEGEQLPKVHHYYREPHPYFGQKLVVIGAANSAVDVALETYRKGADVTMVVRDRMISDRVKYWVKPDIENRIKEGAVKAYFNSSLIKITEREVEIQTPNGIETISNDYVLAMTGYKPDFSLLNRLGINILDSQYQVPEYDPVTMETNQAGLYLAGVICGGLQTHKWFIENSRVHAEMIINHIRKVM
ncbi:YpdA family putative bacillithiol disulfide reductase [Cytophagaceae bacterium ABcell3]|nr:YpdA family putative bacillithiol disulfide reductase [Cytophagaceae bacterium ABcell3]